MTWHLSRFSFALLALIGVTLMAGFAQAAPPAESYWVYFGTYTGPKSKGIYRCSFDTRTGKLGTPEVAAEMMSPSFVTIHPSNKVLYAVGEGGGKEGGPVAAFAIDPTTGALTKLNETLSGGSGPCHISVNPKGTAVAVANYGGGSTKVIALESDGKLIPSKSSFVQHTGMGPDKGRQEGPHAHCSFFDPTGAFVLTSDLGIDRILVYGYDPATAKLTATSNNITAPPGAGPRHFAMTPDGKIVYFCGELDSTVNVAKINLSEGKNEVLQTLSTLPHPVKGNSTAECILHPSGKYVYVSNRGHNSIAVFKVGEDGKLTAAGHITGDIKIPRNFNIDPSGQWMIVCSQDGHQAGVFALDPSTGLGKETGEKVSVGTPVCVKFVPIAK